MVGITPKLSRWYLCSIGMLPMKAVCDEESGRLKGLVFSIRHPELWWYLFGLVVRNVFWVVLISMSWNPIRNHLTANGKNPSA